MTITINLPAVDTLTNYYNIVSMWLSDHSSSPIFLVFVYLFVCYVAGAFFIRWQCRNDRDYTKGDYIFWAWSPVVIPLFTLIMAGALIVTILGKVFLGQKFPNLLK